MRRRSGWILGGLLVSLVGLVLIGRWLWVAPPVEELVAGLKGGPEAEIPNKPEVPTEAKSELVHDSQSEMAKADTPSIVPSPESEIPSSIPSGVPAPSSETDGPKTEAPVELFTNEWAVAWGEKIDESEEYRAASKGWQYGVGLIVEADASKGIPEKKAVYLDLFEGDCRQARLGSAADIESCGFILVATGPNWKSLIQKEIRIIPALLSGKVKLARGDLKLLIQYTKAANIMVELATELPTTYPPGL